MKKGLTIILGVLLAVMIPVSLSAEGQSEGASGDGTWTPKRNINFYIASSPGGGSDMYARAIADVLTNDGLVEKNIVCSNETDGGGEVIRSKVAHMKDDHTILAFVSGAIRKQLKNDDIKITMDDFSPIAILAADKQLFFVGDRSPYTSIEEILEAVKSGKNVVMGGSKSDDMAIYEAFIAEIGVDSDTLTYITYDSSGEAIVSLMGGHVDFCISKPGAAMEYVKSGDLTPILAMSTQRYPEPLDQAPILSELGYNDVELPTWRGIVGPKNMSAEAVAFWSEAFRVAAESPAWQDYMKKNLLVPMYMDKEDARTYIDKYVAQIAKSMGK